jgi:hypothetical protein
VSLEPFYERRAPRCYRRPRTNTAVERRFQDEGSAVLFALSLLTAITVFVLFFRGSLL